MNVHSYKIGGRKDGEGHWKWIDGRLIVNKYWGPGKLKKKLTDNHVPIHFVIVMYGSSDDA